MPGVLLIEGMAQTAGAICTLLRGYDNAPKSVLFLTVDKAKFRRPVVPGDIVEYHMTKKTQKKNMWWFHGEAKVGGALAAEADVGAMIVDN
jgi:3-hydroxyacyl-[acyl-carrier-protein] dehydratase